MVSSAPRWLVIFALLPVYWLLAGTNRASAGCGDYVRIRGEETSHFDGSSLGLIRSFPDPIRKPCHGPGCDQAPIRHMPIPTPPVVSIRMLDAILATVAERDHAPIQHIPIEGNAELPSPVSSGIFHPPRGSSITSLIA
jgi:hypothetical protein